MKRLILFASLLIAVTTAQVMITQGPVQWAMAGADLNDTRSQPSEHQISRENVFSLTTKWVFTTGGDVSGTPAVFGDVVYVPDWAGNLFAIRKDSGQLIWSHKISDYDGFKGAFARVTPAMHGPDLIIGDTQSETDVHNGANLIAVDRATGAMRWITQVDSHPAAIITGSPMVLGDVIYVGISSNEEALAESPSYTCCTFRGGFVAVNANTGQIVWKMFDMPENGGQPGGYSGGAIWQPAAIDPVRGSLYVGTGNNYDVPADVKACQAKAMADNNLKAVCIAPDDLMDTALALDLATGNIKWSKRLQGYDAWILPCIRPREGVSCPSPSGPDYDLGGSGPNLFPNMVGFGQKSGIYWALNPDTGEILWSTLVGPGGTLGGLEWGTATDGSRIYAAITNNAHTPYKLLGGQSIDWGSWAALDVATGKLLWQTADPTPGALDMGAVSVANGVVYTASFDGVMYGLDASTGQILWSFNSHGGVVGSPSIAGGVVYWGSGYMHIPPGMANNKLFAFTLPQ